MMSVYKILRKAVPILGRAGTRAAGRGNSIVCRAIQYLCIFLMLLCLMAPVQAEAIPVARIDASLEQQIAALQQMYNNYVEKILTNLDKIKSIMALAQLPDDFKKLTAAFDIQAQLKGLIGSGGFGDLSSLINTASIGSALQTGKLGGVQLTDVDKDPAELMEAGDPTAAANVTYERVVRTIEESVGLPATSGPNKGKTTKPDSGKSGEEKDAEDAQKESLRIAKDTVPMSFNNMIETAAATAAAGGNVNTNKEMFAVALADQAKNSSIMEITKIMAPYAADPASKASYRYGISKIREQSESALKKAADLSKPEPSMALKAIAGLSAVLVEQQGLQNELLINMTDVMADDIKMSGLIALLELENYSSNVSQNTMRYIDVYNAISK